MVTRFAPAPTGHLHIGHVVNAQYVWGTARRSGGQVLLRIEDHDRQRSRPEFEASIIEDLDWLGFTPDAPLVRQSERGAIYESALQGLRDQGLTYACECSRREIAGSVQPFRAADAAGGSEQPYPGTCAHRGLSEAPARGIRVRLAPLDVRFDDMLQGEQNQRPHDQCGDLLARDRLGFWTYQFAAAVDDLVQGVTHVIRGLDLLASTGRQIQLASLLGRRTPPRFLHHPLVMKDAGRKVSKSDGDTGIRQMRMAGLRAEEVMGAARQFVELPSPSD